MPPRFLYLDYLKHVVRNVCCSSRGHSSNRAAAAAAAAAATRATTSQGDSNDTNHANGNLDSPITGLRGSTWTGQVPRLGACWVAYKPASALAAGWLKQLNCKKIKEKLRKQQS